MSSTAVTDAPAFDRTRTRGRYTRLAALGLVLAAAAPLIIFVATLIAGLPLGGDAAFFLGGPIVALLGAFLVTRFQRAWARILALVISLAMGFMYFWMAFGLAVPAAFADFVPGVLLPLGVLLGVGGSIAALVANRRSRAGGEASAGERGLIRAALALVGLAVVASAILSFLARENVSEAAAAGATEVTMFDLQFQEGTYTVTAATPTTFHVRNTDPFMHTFTVDELNINEQILPGSEALIEVNAQPGTYTLYCIPHSNVEDPDPAEGDMAATIVAE
jgi:plastocyanin